jgi:hypothetical protein
LVDTAVEFTSIAAKGYGSAMPDAVFLRPPAFIRKSLSQNDCSPFADIDHSSSCFGA